MAKQSGLGDNAYVGGYDLSGDITQISIAGGPAALDVTPISASAYVRIGGYRTGSIGFTAILDDAALAEHPTLSPLPTADVIVTYTRGTTLGNAAACCVAKQINYEGTLGADGLMTFAVDAQSNAYGVEWGRQLTAGKRTDTTATNGTSYDFGTGSTTFGAQFYLQVFAFTGTSCTVTIQESSDNGGGDAFAAVTGGAFTAATGVTTQRLATSSGQTVERYLRAVSSGTFSSCTFAVVAVRNNTSVVF